MPFHDNSSLDAAFSTTHGAAYEATITPSGGGNNYTAPVVLKYDVELLGGGDAMDFADDPGLRIRSTTAEFRKAELHTPSGLVKGTSFVANSTTFKIKELVAESTYTLTYAVR